MLPEEPAERLEASLDGEEWPHVQVGAALFLPFFFFFLERFNLNSLSA